MRVFPLLSTYIDVRKNQQFTASIRPQLTKEQQCELKVFSHHIYEYKKGLRSLILTTEKQSNQEYIEYRLKKENIPYVIKPVKRIINVFFGNEECVNVIKTFDKPLNKISDEQDFILGTLLGYDKIQQCQRYLKRLNKRTNSQKG